MRAELIIHKMSGEIVGTQSLIQLDGMGSRRQVVI